VRKSESLGLASGSAGITPPQMRRSATAPSVVLAIASLGVFMAFVDATIVNIAFPSIERSFRHASLSALSWILNAYNIVFAALLIGAGRMADLVGRRRVFRFGLVLFTLASAACAAAPSVPLLVAARVVQAIGAAILVPSSLALVLQAFPHERRAHAVAMWSAMGAMAAGVGPPLGGVLVSAANWRLAFLANLPFGAVAYAMAGRSLIESRTPGQRRLPDLPGGLLLALALGAITLGIVQGSRWGWTDPRNVAAFVIGAGLLVVFVQRCRTHRVPVIDLQLLRIRNVAAANLLLVLCGTGFFAYTLCNVLFLTTVWHYSVLHAGLAITPGPIVAVLVARPTSDLAERVGHRPVVACGALLWSAGLIWFITRIGITPRFLARWLPGMVLLGLGAGMAFPNLASAAVASAPGERFAIATAVNSVARQLGAVLGVALLVAIIGHPAPAGALRAFQHGWWFGAGCFLLVVLASPSIGPVRVAAATVAEVLPRVPAEAVQRLPGITRELKGPMPRVRSSGSPKEFLRATPVFSGLSDDELDAIVGRAQRTTIAAGEWLFRQGDPGDCLYVVRSGRLEVIREEGDHCSVGGIERGAVVGELAVIAHSVRSASIRALRDCELLRLTSADFTALMQTSAPLACSVARALSTQLQSAFVLPPSRRAVPTTICLVAADPQIDAGEIARTLTEALSLGGDAALVTPPSEPTPADPLSTFGPLIDAHEEQHDHVVLLATGLQQPDAWTDFGLARSDRILLVTAGGPCPEAIAARAALQGCELVGWDIAPGSGLLSEWVAALRPQGIHQLASGPELTPTCGRLARRLSGRALGVVLSGGGARAFAHIGVLEELTAAGLLIDRVGGVSMGAFIGAQFAAGRSIEAIDAACFEEWVRRNPINDYTLPRKSLIRGHKAVAMVARVMGAAAIEELPLAFYCASTDVRRSELVIHRDGSLAQAVTASISLPILAPPRVDNGHLLVDGSLLDNLPIAPLAASGEGPVIAVDIKPRVARAVRPADAAGRMPRPPRTRIPPLGETIGRVLQLAAADTTAAASRHADFVIRAGVEGVGLLEFHQIDAARQAGRRAALEALEQWTS
jgi:EmrB/QacA subfamily drug resistance transporter